MTIKDQLVGLRINSKVLVENHPQLVDARSSMGFSGKALVIRGGSGTDGTPMRADLHSPRPMKVSVKNSKGVVRLKRFRPNHIYSKTISVVDCVPCD